MDPEEQDGIDQLLDSFLETYEAPATPEPTQRQPSPVDSPVEDAVIETPAAQTLTPEEIEWRRGMDPREAMPQNIRDDENYSTQGMQAWDYSRASENNEFTENELLRLNYYAQWAEQNPDRAPEARAQAHRILQGRDLSFTEGVFGVADTVRIMGWNGFIDAAYGLAGAANTTLNLVSGGYLGRTMDEAANDIRAGQERWGASPWAVGSHEILREVAPVMQAVDDGAKELSATLGMGNPEASTMIYTTIMGAPEVVGTGIGVNRVRRLTSSRGDLNAHATHLINKAEEIGLDLESTTIRMDLETAIRSQGTEVRDEGFEGLQSTLQRLEQEQSAKVDQLYDSARNAGPAYIENGQRSVAALRREIMDDLRDFQTTDANGGVSWDSAEFGVVERRLSELNDIINAEGTQSRIIGTDGLPIQRSPAQVSVQQLVDIRRRANAQRRGGDGDRFRAERAALSRMNRHIDGYLMKQFQEDMIRGDTNSVTFWRDANTNARNYFQTWTENKFLMNIIDEGMDASSVKRIILGASNTRFRNGSLGMIEHLKTVLGDDAKELNALRYSFIDDIISPLRKLQLNGGSSGPLNQFIRNYDNFMDSAGNRQILEALDFDIERDLRPLREFAETIKDIEPTRISWPKLSDLAARFTFGHAIAKAGMRVALGRTLFQQLFSRRASSAASIIGDVVSRFDPEATQAMRGAIIPRESVAASAIIYDNAMERLGYQEPTTEEE